MEQRFASILMFSEGPNPVNSAPITPPLTPRPPTLQTHTRTHTHTSRSICYVAPLNARQSRRSTFYSVRQPQGNAALLYIVFVSFLTGRQAGLRRHGRQQHGRAGALFRRFHHERVSGRYCQGKHPQRNHRGEVERADPFERERHREKRGPVGTMWEGGGARVCLLCIQEKLSSFPIRLRLAGVSGLMDM